MKATICPTESSPRILLSPPAQITTTMPTFTQIVSSGPIADVSRITRIAYDEGEVGILELLDSLRVTRLANLRVLELQAGIREAQIELERVLGFELNGGEVRP